MDMTKDHDHYALVIGVDNYVSLPSIRGAAKDATEFAAWLTSPDGGRVPEQNMQLFISQSGRPVTPADAHPQKWELDRALSYYGAESGARIGKRIYFYFAGYAFDAGDDLGLLMADADVTHPGYSLGLRAYQEFFRAAALFDEVVYVLDCSGVVLASAHSLGPSIQVRQAHARRNVSDLVLACLSGNGSGRLGRGLLTRIVLEGLGGAAADADGRVTAAELSRFVRQGVHASAEREVGQQQLRVELADSELTLLDRQATPAHGTLVVQVPHWACQVRILDNLQRPTPDVGALKEVPSGAAIYQCETQLALGIYEVEVVLENESEHRLILVRPGERHTLRVGGSRLKVKSSAPLAGTATTRETHTDAAVKWSTKQTGADVPGGEGNLFLFVRTLKPAQYRSFVHGLYLLDVEGKQVANFAEGVKENADEGWLAFNADLAPGYYILRRGRRGVRVRYQPIYICAGWQTQVFITARKRLSLRSLTLNMARRGAGFHPDDETALAADIVLDSLRQPRKSAGLITSEKMAALINDKRKNPWLGILAAYALLRARADLSPQQDSAGLARRQIDDLLSRALSSLSAIGDHPDVRAINLQDEVPATAPFHYPPLLWTGLRRVQRHATRFEETVPLDSLTDHVLEHLVANSPWTAWREPHPGWHDAKHPVPSRMRKTAVTEPAPWTVGTNLLYAAAPNAPIFRVNTPSAAEVSQDTRPDQPVQRGIDEPLPGASLIEIVRLLGRIASPESLPTAVSTDPKRTLNELLRTVGTEVAKISEASGLPLARVTSALESLRRLVTEDASSVTARLVAILPAAEQAVVEYALGQVAASTQATASSSEGASQASRDVEAMADVMAADDPTSSLPPSPSAVVPPPSPVEGLVSKLQVEVDRLLLQIAENQLMDEIATQVLALVKRLDRVADELLEYAEFAVITDPAGHLLSRNAAFVALEASSERDATQNVATIATTSEQRPSAAQLAWKAALKAAPTGLSIIEEPRATASRRTWELRRVPMENQATGGIEGFLNVFRRAGREALPPDVVQSIDEKLIDQLQKYAALVAYGTPGRRGDYAKHLAELTKQLEAIVGVVASAADRPDQPT